MEYEEKVSPPPKAILKSFLTIILLIGVVIFGFTPTDSPLPYIGIIGVVGAVWLLAQARTEVTVRVSEDGIFRESNLAPTLDPKVCDLSDILSVSARPNQTAYKTRKNDPYNVLTRDVEGSIHLELEDQTDVYISSESPEVLENKIEELVSSQG